MKRFSPLAFVLIAGSLFITGCKHKQYLFNEGYIFGTVYHITYRGSEDLQTGIEAELAKFDAALSMFNPASTISRINKSGTEPFDLKKEEWTRKVIEESILISEKTHGAFDITVAPLVNAWGFGFRKMDQVTPAQIDSIRTFVSYKLLTIHNDKLIKADPRIQLDCSAVAKGYACDIVANYLRSQGVTDYLVEIGGEMTLSGKNPNGGLWRVGINKPVDDSTSSNMEWEQKLELTDRAIATSGNYRKFYVKDGKKFAHTIDPHTGYPVQHSLLSATVIAKDCLTADAFATAFMVLGLDSAVAIAERTPDMEGLFLYNDGSKENKVRFTSGIPALQKEQ
jgi:FAD:protein FMN transferase